MTPHRFYSAVSGLDPPLLAEAANLHLYLGIDRAWIPERKHCTQTLEPVSILSIYTV